MELKLPAEEDLVVATDESEGAFIQAYIQATDLAEEETDKDIRYRPTHMWEDFADYVNRREAAIRESFDRKMLAYLEANDWNMDCYPAVRGGASTIFSSKEINEKYGMGMQCCAPYFYFAGPVRPKKDDGLARDNKPVYYNTTQIRDEEPPVYRQARCTYEEMKRALPEVKVPSVSRMYDGRRPLLPFILALPVLLCVFVWRMRFGAVDGHAIQASLQGAAQQGGLMGKLSSALEWCMGVLNGFVDWTYVQNAPDLEIVGPIIMYICLGLVAGGSLLLAIWAVINNRNSRIKNRKEWRGLKKQAKEAKQKNKEIRAQNIQRKKDAAVYKQSAEYLAAVKAFDAVKAENKRKRELSEQWHRAWFEACEKQWRTLDFMVQPYLANDFAVISKEAKKRLGYWELPASFLNEK